MMSNASTLEKEIDRLNKEQRAIEERLKDFGGRHQDYNKKKRPFFAESSDQEQLRAKPRVMSAVAAVIHHDSVTPVDSHGAVDCPSKPLIRKQNLNPDAVRRNRRMFGALMGHLGKAQQSLKTDSELLERQNAMKSTAMHRHVEESKRIIKQQKKLSLHEKNMELNLRDEVIAKRRKAELALQTIAYKEEQEKLLNFIVTNAIPPLPWRPGRMNAITEQLLQEHKNTIVKRLEERDMSNVEMHHLIDTQLADKKNKRMAEEQALDDEADADTRRTFSRNELNYPVENLVNSTSDTHAYDDKEEEDEGDRILAALDGNHENTL